MSHGLLTAVASACALVGASADSALNSPVTKIVTLLQDLQLGLEQEAKDDKETYKALKCWCDKNGQEKRDAVEAAKQANDLIQSKIESGAGRTGQLDAELGHLKQRITEDEAALREAIEMRQKEAAEFHDQEKELISSIRLLEGAIETLGKHHPAMLQQGAAELQALRPQLRHLVHKHIDLLGFLRTSLNKDALLSLLDANPDILEDDNLHSAGLLDTVLLQQQRRGSLRRAAQPAGFQSYSPQSGQVIGILKQMKDAFNEDLPQVQQVERSKADQFNMMKEAKEQEIAMQKKQVAEKGGDEASTKADMWTDRSDIKDAQASLAADQAFLQELTERCDAGDREFEKRMQMRSEEITAVSEAVQILTVDEVRDAQSTTFGAAAPTLLQLSRNADRRQLVRFVQERVAKYPALALVAAAARNEPLKKVAKFIDDLVEQLKVQQADEVKMRDFCVSELHENQVDTERKTAEHQDLLAQAEALTAAEANLVKALDTLKADIKMLEVELQRASNNRKKENFEYRQVVGDQRALQLALRAAQSKLRVIFEKRQSELQISELLQQDPADEAAEFHKRGSGPRPTVAPAPKFKDYDTKSGATTNVLTLMEQLIGEAKVLEDASVHDEQNAQKAYETFISETNDSVDAKSRMTTDKMAELASTEQQLRDTNDSVKLTGEELHELANMKAAVHKQCDFLLKNFELRQEARANEMQALGEAKALVSGMAKETA